MKLKELNAFDLKILAITAMFIDHAVAITLSHDSFLGMFLRFPGRIVAPVMCYLIAEGYYKTSNPIKYVKRLFLFSLISHLPYNLLFGFDFFEATSVMWGLFLGLASLIVIKMESTPFLLKLGFVGLACVLSLTANWNYVVVLWIVFFGLFHGDVKKQMISFLIVGTLAHIVPTFINFGLLHSGFPHWYQLGIYFAVPLLGAYTGERGHTSKVMQYGFYIFYPAHLVFLYLFDLLFTNFL